MARTRPGSAAARSAESRGAVSTDGKGERLEGTGAARRSRTPALLGAPEYPGRDAGVVVATHEIQKQRGDDGRRLPLPQDIASRIEASVQVGRYEVGSRLPPERDLCIRMRVSRNILREALRVLETRGIVEIRHGVGAFVIGYPSAERAQVPIEVRLERAAFPVNEVMVGRRAIECAVVEVAARARDDTDLARLRELLDEAARCVSEGDTTTYVDLDVKFHEYLGTCTHNRLLEDVQAELTKATLSVRSIATETFDAMRAAMEFHGEILDALARGDGEAARAAMVMHLLDARERLVAGLISAEGSDRSARGQRSGRRRESR